MIDEPPLASGELLAPGYTVCSLLRRSRTLDVYDVWSEERRCHCVAKTLRPDRAGDRKARARLIGEGRLLARLSHPHIVRAYETLREPRLAVVLEPLMGATLEHLLASTSRRLAQLEVVYLGLHLCSAIGYLHRRGYLHLDLKPSNVISDNGTARVIDFSIARRPGRGRPGIGTRQYLAPEQARGGWLGPPADIWGIGAVLFEATTGRRPFAAFEGRRFDQLERRIEPLRTHRRGAPALARLVDACLEPDPMRRPSLDSLYAELRSLEASLLGAPDTHPART